MTLAAKQVTDALAARLLPMVATGGRVYQTRTLRITDADLPCWRVIAASEMVEAYTIAGDNKHTLNVLVGAFARDTATLEDDLSALIAAGQALLFADPKPYGLELAAIDRDVSTVGEAAVGVFTLTVRATYIVNPKNPETLLSS